jgi:hypothetical protein
MTDQSFIDCAMAERTLLDALRASGSVAVRALKLRSPEAADALLAYLDAHAATVRAGKRRAAE